MFAFVLTTVLATVTSLGPTPQDGPDQRVIAGRVLDTAGQPVAGATVTLLARPIPTIPDPATEHRLTLTTDARGMFRGKLNAQQDYSAWARWPQRSSAIVEGVHGGFVELRATPGRLAESCRVGGIEAWEKIGVAIRCRTIVGTENIDFVDVPLEDERAVVPALPSMPPMFEFLDADGRVLWAMAPQRTGDEGWISIPPPQKVRIRAEDGAGQPIAGATIRRHIRNYWYTTSPSVRFGDRFCPLWPACGTTDQKGELTAIVPLTADASPVEMWLLAEKPGARSVLFGWHDSRVIREGTADKKKTESPVDEVAVATMRAPEGAARNLAVGGALLDGHASLLMRASMQDAQGGGRGTLLMMPAMKVEGGRVLGFDLPKQWKSEGAWVALSASRAAELEKALGVRVPRAVHLRPRSRATNEFLDPLDPAANRVLQIIDPDGRPASGALALITPHQEQRFSSGTRTLRADRQGRILVPKGRGEQLVVVASGTGYGRVTLTDDATDRRPLSLRERPVVAGVAVNDKGEPVAGMRLSVGRIVDPHGEVDLEDLDPKLLPFAMANSLLNLLPPTVSAADGTFRYRFLPAEGTLRLRIEGGWGTWPKSEWQELPADASETPSLRFEIDPAASGGR